MDPLISKHELHSDLAKELTLKEQNFQYEKYDFVKAIEPASHTHHELFVAEIEKSYHQHFCTLK